MDKKQYVQHISGQGEKWALCEIEQQSDWPSWVAPHTEKKGGLLYLPKSEYVLCDPPEQWVDVTDVSEVEDGSWGKEPDVQYVKINGVQVLNIYKLLPYRLRKANGRILVERKEPS